MTSPDQYVTQSYLISTGDMAVLFRISFASQLSMFSFHENAIPLSYSLDLRIIATNC